jgi:ABC-2 type transport system permease protein
MLYPAEVALRRIGKQPAPGQGLADRVVVHPQLGRAERYVLGARAAGPGEFPDAVDRVVIVGRQDQPGPRAERVGLPDQPARAGGVRGEDRRVLFRRRVEVRQYRVPGPLDQLGRCGGGRTLRVRVPEAPAADPLGVRGHLRNPASAFFIFAFPLMFLVIFTALLGHGTIRVSPGKVVDISTYYVAAMASFGVISACYTNIAISVSFQRDTGVLKRTNGTPLPSAAFLGARMLHALLVGILLVVITAGFGRLLYSASIPAGLTLLRFLVMLLVGAASFCALGFAITAVIPNADAAPAIVNASILPLLFLSGVFIPLGSNAPAWIVWIARIFPVWQFARGMQAGFLGTAFSWADVIIVAAWGLAGLLASVRFFSWEPRT